MGTVLAVVYAADTIVAFKYYRDSGDWLSLGEWSAFPSWLAQTIMIVIIRLI